VLIEYAGNDRLYIPADRVSIIQKYIGADETHPKLDQLGGHSWNLVKKKARKSVREIARHLVELYALRRYRKGHSFSPPDNYYREFEATFEHEETPDQSRAIEEVLEDMGSERPMDRLICGDVGFGKTEIAVRAAFKAVSDGKQVALLVPTTVLAEQHYETFRKRMAPYPFRVGILSRFKSQAEQRETLAKLRSGEVDILVGTHRILQKDVAFRDLGLLIIDEEQRFGVKQKEALKRFRALVDVLALTATPIPRTFQMSLLGLRDLSVIETPPEDRMAIQTYLSSYDESLIARAVASERERGGQVFFVHNRVQDIDHVAARVKELVGGARLGVAHGQLPERDLEKTMLQFLHREIDVLVCSTIIESGLDIPSANTIIIDEVDRLGLAQIYQLRGRVGRAKEKAYAYLLLSRNAELTRDAEKRLKALMDFSQLGAGIHLAMHDLKIRGGGNILGFAQSGQIAAVGYELYTRLIEEAISELKGEEPIDEINPEINLEIPAYLPEEYVRDADVRLNLYRRLSSLREEKDLNAMEEEIRDRFGDPPVSARNLLGVMAVRLLLKKKGISRLDAGPGQIVLTFSPDARVDVRKILDLVTRRPRVYQFVSQHKLRIHAPGTPGGADLAWIRSVLAGIGQ
jgi:transcription-repair coupling factor (superfamily II helicase)